MMIFTTKYVDSDGITWMKDEDRITAISRSEAEHKASLLNLTVVGQLIEEEVVDDNLNTIEIINYDIIQNN